ncbi:MAG: NUDIX hydrolase [bacterium]
MRYFLVKTFWFFVNPFRKIYLFIVRPNTRGVKCLVENNGKFLFVKLNYAHHKWTIPGGGVGKNESFIDSAIREVKEEAGIDILSPIFIGRYESRKEYKKDVVEVYLGNSDRIDTKVDPIEIEKAEWFTRNNIPENRSSSVDKIFEFYDEYKLKTN